MKIFLLLCSLVAGVVAIVIYSLSDQPTNAEAIEFNRLSREASVQRMMYGGAEFDQKAAEHALEEKKKKNAVIFAGVSGLLFVLSFAFSRSKEEPNQSPESTAASDRDSS